ncbi:MAG: dihydrodipicolinate synthase family protein, partial [Deltaproteobacteria bacterium]|nr:dihydrodipicolinate synthase family protein [Deltaproteobacteria bacterium]
MILSGVFAPMVTAFDSEGRLDLESNERIVEHLIAG